MFKKQTSFIFLLPLVALTLRASDFDNQPAERSMNINNLPVSPAKVLAGAAAVVLGFFGAKYLLRDKLAEIPFDLKADDKNLESYAKLILKDEIKKPKTMEESINIQNGLWKRGGGAKTIGRVTFVASEVFDLPIRLDNKTVSFGRYYLTKDEQDGHVFVDGYEKFGRDFFILGNSQKNIVRFYIRLANDDLKAISAEELFEMGQKNNSQAQHHQENNPQNFCEPEKKISGPWGGVQN